MTGHAPPPEVTSTFRVGKRYTCTVTAPVPVPGRPLMLTVEWEPHVPTRRLSKAEARDYRRGRDTVVAELARLAGGSVLVLEV
jgi:hypothetical protein